MNHAPHLECSWLVFSTLTLVAVIKDKSQIPNILEKTILDQLE